MSTLVAFTSLTGTSLLPVQSLSAFSKTNVVARRRTILSTRPRFRAQATSTSLSSNETPTLFTCTPDDLSALVKSATDAFIDDPVLRWCFGPVSSTEADYAKTIYNINLGMLSYALNHPESAVVRSDKQRRALSVCYQPGKFVMSQQMASTWRLLFLIGPWKLFRMLRFLYPISKGAPKDPHIYLIMIACCRDAQNQGLGTALMSEITAECDRRNVAAYLESSNAANSGFYKKRGFESMGEVEGLAEGAPPVTRMWRSVEGNRT